MKSHSLYSSNRSNWTRVPAGDSHWGKLPTAGSALMNALLARVVQPDIDAGKKPGTPKDAGHSK